MYVSQRLRSLLAALFLLGLIALTVLPARAATHTVTDCGDNGGAGQLRTLINSAADGDTINIPACTITLTGAANDNANASGDLDLNKNLSLNGAGAGSTIINGGNVDRVFHITGVFTVAISNMTITGGNVSGGAVPGGFEIGGGISNSGMLTLSNSIVSNNIAATGVGVGGGIANNGTLNINNSTLSGNSAAYYGGGINNNGTLTVNNSILGNNIASNNAGGGIYNDAGTLTINASTLSGNSSFNGGGIYTIRGTVIVANSTFSGNSAEPGNGSGGGIASSSPGTVTITNSTVSNNSAFYGGGIAAITNVTIRNTIIANSPAGGDCAGVLTDGGNNIVEDNSCSFTGGSDPLLGPLVNHGGPTKTHALLTGSPAIDAGSNAVCAASPVNNVDQRSVTRPQGAVCDIGAFELEAYFTEIDVSLANANHGSLAWGDYDNDGDVDLLQTGRSSSGFIAKLYGNDNGLLTDVNTPFTGVEGGSADWGDYDGDGDLDVALMGFNGNTPEGYFTKVYRNDNGAFTDINAALPGTAYGTVDWGDYDHDGDLDILLNGEPISGRITRVYRNNGGLFTDINASLAGTVYGSAAWGDYDNDNDLDILVTGDGISNSKVYRNDGGTFTDINANLIFSRLGKGVWGDYDNDGDLDILISGAGSKLYRNDGADTFTDSGVSLVQFDDSAAAWGDFDNDGKLDFVIGGRNYSDFSRSSAIYRNTGNGNFTLITYLYNVGANAAAWGDLDNDGDLDLALSGQDTNGAPLTRFYRNNLLTPSVIPPPPTLNFPDTVHPPQSPRPLFDWNNVPNATYTLQIATNRNFTALVINLNLSSSAHIPTTHLPRSTTLYWRVRANNAFGVSAWSLVKSFDSPNPPGAPIIITPTSGLKVTSLTPTLDWSDSTPTPERYEAQIATDSGFVNVLGRGQGGPTAQSQYTPEVQLAAATTYYWRVRAFGGASPNGQLLFSDWSMTGSFKTP